jgi:hypothetical protein
VPTSASLYSLTGQRALKRLLSKVALLVDDEMQSVAAGGKDVVLQRRRSVVGVHDMARLIVNTAETRLTRSIAGKAAHVAIQRANSRAFGIVADKNTNRTESGSKMIVSSHTTPAAMLSTSNPIHARCNLVRDRASNALHQR